MRSTDPHSIACGTEAFVATVVAERVQAFVFRTLILLCRSFLRACAFVHGILVIPAFLGIARSAYETLAVTFAWVLGALVRHFRRFKDRLGRYQVGVTPHSANTSCRTLFLEDRIFTIDTGVNVACGDIAAQRKDHATDIAIGWALALVDFTNSAICQLDPLALLAVLYLLRSTGQGTLVDRVLVKATRFRERVRADQVIAIAVALL